MRKLLLGETWTVPIGVALVVLAGLALDLAGGGDRVLGPVMVVLVTAVIVVATRPGAR